MDSFVIALCAVRNCGDIVTLYKIGVWNIKSTKILGIFYAIESMARIIILTWLDLTWLDLINVFSFDPFAVISLQPPPCTSLKIILSENFTAAFRNPSSGFMKIYV